jgi:hypothetical protein
MILTLTTPPVTPLTEFTLACDRLLNDRITRVTLTNVELDILQMCVHQLTERFFIPRRFEKSAICPPMMFPHGGEGAVE